MKKNFFLVIAFISSFFINNKINPIIDQSDVETLQFIVLLTTYADYFTPDKYKMWPDSNINIDIAIPQNLYDNLSKITHITNKNLHINLHFSYLLNRILTSSLEENETFLSIIFNAIQNFYSTKELITQNTTQLDQATQISTHVVQSTAYLTGKVANAIINNNLNRIIRTKNSLPKRFLKILLFTAASSAIASVKNKFIDKSLRDISPDITTVVTEELVKNTLVELSAFLFRYYLINNERDELLEKIKKYQESLIKQTQMTSYIPQMSYNFSH